MVIFVLLYVCFIYCSRPLKLLIECPRPTVVERVSTILPAPVPHQRCQETRQARQKVRFQSIYRPECSTHAETYLVVGWCQSRHVEEANLLSCQGVKLLSPDILGA